MTPSAETEVVEEFLAVFACEVPTDCLTLPLLGTKIEVVGQLLAGFVFHWGPTDCLSMCLCVRVSILAWMSWIVGEAG